MCAGERNGCSAEMLQSFQTGSTFEEPIICRTVNGRWAGIWFCSTLVPCSHYLTCVFEQLKIHSSNIPQDKTDVIIKHINEGMDKFTIEKVITDNVVYLDTGHI
jgi:hypothetical protein